MCGQLPYVWGIMVTKGGCSPVLQSRLHLLQLRQQLEHVLTLVHVPVLAELSLRYVQLAPCDEPCTQAQLWRKHVM